MTTHISSRRQIITVVLLVLAVGGGIVRWLAPQPSLARDMGSMLLVLWLPIVGNIIGWLIQKAKTPRNMPPGFSPDAVFEASARVEITLMAAAVPAASRPIRAGYFSCTLVLGDEAFTARLEVPNGSEPLPEVASQFEAQFLRPELALAKLPPGTPFTLLSGRDLLGTGKML